MEENNSKHKASPRLPEALHPEIGNGALWEENGHAFLLRSPDPSKSIDRLLGIDASQTFKIDFSIENAPEIPLFNNILPEEPLVEPELIVDEAFEVNARDIQKPKLNPANTAPEVLGAKKAKKDVTGKKKNKPEPHEDASDVVAQETLNEIPEARNKSKAGKLIKKAAKTVKKQEEAKMQEKKEKEGYPESTLSPYTKWLKSLTGSEYVHPFEDDFAFEKGSGSSKEGISETFADLLASQGYKEQAIGMYVKLTEKYPEKSTFFAAKIEALQH